LTKIEEENPFRFHEAIADIKVRNITIGDEEVVDGEEVVEDVVVDATILGDEKTEEVVK
jgi:hypothetical protein